MEMSNYRLESHVAQQSRRDKLRIQQNQNQNFQDYTHNSYDPTVFSSEMFNFGANSPVLSATAQPDKQLVAENPSFHSFSHPISAKLSGDPQNCDWNSIVNYSKLNGISQFGDVQFVSSPINYQNTLQEVVTTSHGYSWGDGGNVLALLPSFVDQSDSLRVGDACDGDLRPFTKDNSNTQGLSLSLSSVNPHGGQFGEGYNSEHFYSSRINNANVSVDVIDSKSNLKSEYLCSNHKSPIIVGSPLAFAHRSTGPLGPFTGYATILKSSKFLKPAQNLLDDICSVAGPRPISTSECLINMSEEVGVCPDAKNSNSGGASSSTFYGSNEINSSNESHLPEYQQKKAKLLYMHEEVCKRYKQYHQQMQMVVSSFQSVAGLDAATPYISLALKTISRHFRSLRNAISDQLRDTKTILGEEDLSSPTTGPTVSTSRLKFNNSENGFQKPQRLGGGNAVFFEPQHPAWRPQRGLPERAVSVLRAWLFDHFLHPYPTDTDKHMLATQTGLSRNQVSNWFINARVRVWKPMVEEIHMLETKGSTESSCKTRRPPTGEVPAQQNDSQPENGHGFSNPISERHAEFSGVGPSTCGVGDHGPDPDPWMTREKKSRMECQIPMGMDRSLMGFTPYHRSGLESGGMGPVSLTLGLRQSAESGQEQQFHFGGHMIHDFVG